MTIYNVDMHDHATSVKRWAEFLGSVNNGKQWLYMLIDAAHDSRIFPALERSSHARCCLFDDTRISGAVRSVAPFLVKIKKIDEFIMWCMLEGLHRNWMLFFSSPEMHVSELRIHFKRYSFVHTHEGKQCLFRYYDPRILPVYLESLDKRERTQFFLRCNTIWIPLASSTVGVQFLQFEAEGVAQVLNTPSQFSKLDHSGDSAGGDRSSSIITSS
jgi:hypothetical protein